MRYRVIVFDYDGTLALSNEIKRGAYFKVLPGHEAIVASVLKKNPGDSRRAIIRKCLLQVNSGGSVGETDLSGRVEVIAREYDRLATAGAASCPERPGATAGLSRLSALVPLYLLSATPQASLRRIVRLRGWQGFFCRVVGVPVPEKAGMLEAFALEQGVETGDVLMVGDSPFDRDAAHDAGAGYFHMEAGFTMEDLLFILDETFL